MAKASSTEKPVVSVVIPSYNVEQHIKECLIALQRQKTALPYEIIVVDSSKDNTPSVITTYFPTVKLFHLDTQTYPGAARNVGTQEARGDIIAFIDSDCIATENWLEQGLAAIKSGYSVVGGSVANANPGLISWSDYFLTFNEFVPSMPRREVGFMPTCNFFITKEAFQNIGGFRADLLAGEDTLFCVAARKHYKLLFHPAVQISHKNRERWRAFLHHHRTFGRHSAYVRKIADLPGKALVKNPLLALAAPVVRFARITQRMLRWNPKALPQFIMTLPLLLLGIVAWGFGFITERWKKKEPF